MLQITMSARAHLGSLLQLIKMEWSNLLRFDMVVPFRYFDILLLAFHIEYRIIPYQCIQNQLSWKIIIQQMEQGNR